MSSFIFRTRAKFQLPSRIVVPAALATMLHIAILAVLLSRSLKFSPFPAAIRIHLFSLASSPSRGPATTTATQEVHYDNIFQGPPSITNNRSRSEAPAIATESNDPNSVPFPNQNHPSITSNENIDNSPIDTASLSEEYITRAVPLLNRPEVKLHAWQIEQDNAGNPAVIKHTLWSRKRNEGELFETKLDSTGKPTQARFIRNGVEIPCTPADVEFMWYNMRGLRALWNFYDENKMLSMYRTLNRPLPDVLFGRPTLLRLKTGMVFIGILEKESQGRGMYVKLNIDGKYVDFYVRIISTVEQVKSAYGVNVAQ